MAAVAADAEQPQLRRAVRQQVGALHQGEALVARESAGEQRRDRQEELVDEPRDSVEQADALVADLMQRLAAGFAGERERLESQWESGDDVSTEDLRVALTRYRSFFDRLLSA